MAPQRRVRPADHQKIMYPCLGDRDLEVVADLTGHRRRLLGRQRSRIGQHKENRRLIPQPQAQRLHVPARQQQTAVHRLRPGWIVI